MRQHQQQLKLLRFSKQHLLWTLSPLQRVQISNAAQQTLPLPLLQMLRMLPAQGMLLCSRRLHAIAAPAALVGLQQLVALLLLLLLLGMWLTAGRRIRTVKQQQHMMTRQKQHQQQVGQRLVQQHCCSQEVVPELLVCIMRTASAPKPPLP
jgi:hypothetical protein